MRERGSQERRNHRKIPVRRLSPQEIRAYIKGDNKPDDLFLGSEDVMGLNVGGVNLIFVDINSGHTSPDSLTRRLIEHPRTTGVFAAYFGHELNLNGVYNQNNPFIRRYLERTPGARDRLAFAQNLADVCKEARKPVFVADIANKPLFTIYDELYKNPFAPVLGTIAAVATHQYPLAIPLGLWASNTMRRFMQEGNRTGMFNPDQITKFERLIPDLEQARRLFVAKGLEQLASEISSSTPASDNETIIVPYAIAHGRRIVELVEHPKRIADTARDLMYRGMAPFLDHALRRYDVNEDGEWSPVKRTRIKIIPRRPKLSPATETN